jgi:hypothetical protein
VLVTNLIQALGRRRTTTGKPVYFIHVRSQDTVLPDMPLKLPQSSVTTLFSEEAGWPHGMLKDTDSIYEKEKELGGAHPVRLVS